MKKSEKSKKNPEISENENTAIQNLWNTTKAALREKCIVMQAYLRKQKVSDSNVMPRESRTNKTQS